MAELARLDIQIGADVKNATRGIDDLNRSLQKINVPAAKIAQQSQAATNSLGALGQVARDLPFGFIAIQNNLPILFDQFGALTKQSGGVINALKAVGGALAGPAGVSFAIGAAISAITSLTQKYGSIGNALNVLFLRTDAVAEATRKMRDAQLEAVASTQGEIVKINTLVGVLGSNNASQQERINAYNNLKKEYPGVIQNMTQENALSAAGTELIRQRANELIKFIKLRAQESALSKLLEEAYIKQQKAIANLTQKSKLDEFLTGVQAGFQSIVSGKTIGEALTKDLSDANKEIDLLSEKLAGLTIDINKIDPKITGNLDFKIKKIKPVQVPFELGPLESVQRDPDQEILRRFKLENGITVPFKIALNNESAERSFKAFQDKLRANVRTAGDIMLEFSNNINQIVAQGITDAFVNLGEAIGSALTGGGFKSITRVFVAFGQLLTNIGQQAIKSGLALVSLRKALSFAGSNPALLIAAGVALSALGSVIKNKFSSQGVTGFAQGGIVTAPTLGLIGEAGEKEAVIPLSKLDNLIGGVGGNQSLVAEVSGDALRFVLSRAERRQSRGF